MIRVIEQADARKQQSAQAIPKRGTGFQLVENMAKMAMPLNQAIQQAGKKSDLKKQSQFEQAQYDAMSFMQGDYNNNPTSRAQENKANYTSPYWLKWREKEKIGCGSYRLAG